VLSHEFIDLINSPPSNSFLTKEQLNEPEIFFPLKLFVCEKCWLVQIDELKRSDEIFSQDYAYFSSYSKSWLEHAKRYTDMITQRFGLGKTSQVIEIGSNDGYLLQYFQQKNIPCLGIEPTQNTAAIAMGEGIPVIIEFFGENLAQHLSGQGKIADLLIGNNVLAHVPDLNDFVKGLTITLKSDGVITMEFPHLMRLIELNQFDTIYHEHFSYFSFGTACNLFSSHGLSLFDVEELPTHGGSLRIYAKHQSNNSLQVTDAVSALLAMESDARMKTLHYYKNFQHKIDNVKYDIVSFLIEQKSSGKKVIAYGAAAKGNTLLNYCGIKTDLIEFVVDASPYKQGKFLPGSHIPVIKEEEVEKLKPDYVLILPWNIKDEIIEQLKYIRQWGGRFVLPIPRLQVFP